MEILTEAKNTHMEHIEDNVFNDGVNGARQAINYIQQMRDTLNGSTPRPMRVTVKWDGAPAIFVGEDPSDGQFFVAKKGIFNKNPKVYKTNADIDKDTSGDLNNKLKKALRFLKPLGIKDVIQGDFLYDKDDLKKETIDGIDYIVFHPNTIAYSVPAESTLAKKLLKSEIGIVWHTSYKGKDFESMKASYGVNVNKIRKSDKVWQIDAEYRDLSGSATLTARETKALDKILSQVGKDFQGIKGQTLNNIANNPELSMRLKSFVNLNIRARRNVNPNAAPKAFLDYVQSLKDIAKSKLKTPRGKQGVDNKFKPIMTWIARTNKREIINIFRLYNGIIQAKQVLLRKLDSGAFLRTFVKTSDGFKVTGSEGFVAIDHLGRNAVKLVDRLEFSFNNFSPTILKGWETERRT